MSTYIYLTRHGETVWNTKKLMQGWKDSPLTERGIEQAEQLGDRLSDVPFNAIYSSTSNRAVHTAEIIRGNRSLEIMETDKLRELSFGDWEGRTFEENERECGELWRCFWETPHLFSHNSVESFIHVQDRMMKTINGIVTQHSDETVCIVSHSIALKLLLNHLGNNKLENLWATPAIPPTSLTLLKIDNTASEILFENDTSHYAI